MEVLIPFQMAKIIDEGIQGQNLGYVIRMGHSHGSGSHGWL